MSLTTKKINNVRVNAIPQETQVNGQKIKGYELFPEIYSNIFICSRKRTGKTTIINTILNNCMGKDTKLIIFSTTHQKDKNMKAIIKKWKKKHTVLTFHNIKSSDGVDELDTIVETLSVEEAENDDSEEEEEEKHILIFNNEKKEKTRKKRKPKYLSPEYIFVLDDLAEELRSKSVYKLLSTNRHYKAKVILSNQWLRAIQPSSRRQLDYLLLLKGHTQDKLNEIYNELDLDIDVDCFIEMYNKAISSKYGFFYVSIIGSEYRQNFNTKLITSDIC